MNFKFSKKSLDKISEVNKDLALVFIEAIKVCPVDFGIPSTGGLRSELDQAALFDKGVSLCDGYNSRSKHQDGLALDFYAYINGKASWNKVHLSIVASCILTVAKQLKQQRIIQSTLKWGAEFSSDDFNGYDFPHIEII